MQIKPLELQIPTDFMAASDASANAAPVVKESRSLIHPFADFWLLGGASILVWAVMAIGQFTRGDVQVVEQRFMQVAATFALLSLICNHPHFISSYKLAYSRGLRFVFRHWFCLIVVPVSLIGLYTYAFLNFSQEIDLNGPAGALNRFAEKYGFGPRISEFSNIGTEVVGLSVWLMYLTLGWHYAKQAFGCMTVYAKYDGYRLAQAQRRLIKLSVFSIALYQFCYFTAKIARPSSDGNPFRFMGVPLAPFQIPEWAPLASGSLVAAFAVLVLGFVVGWNWWKSRTLPSMNFLVPWIALHVWWFPVFHQPEFYFLVIPFFHSLQYLPFVYRVEATKTENNKWPYARISLLAPLILIAGFLAFEYVPATLDTSFGSGLSHEFWFFSIAIPVFINIHHFFIDAAIWKFDQREVQNGLFGDDKLTSTRRAS